MISSSDHGRLQSDGRSRSRSSGNQGVAISVTGLDYAVTDRKGRALEILKNINLQIADGEFVSIVGPSGCGKSTLLNFISGLIPSKSGEISVLQEPVRDGNAAVGYMFQQHALMPWRTVLRNTELGLELQGIAAVERTRCCGEMLRNLGLSGFENHYPSEISGGMRQRASLARTLVADPRVLLMDEPFGALDAQTKMLIHEMFLAYWEAHRRTVLFVTHDLAEAISLSDRVLVMSARPGCFIGDHRIEVPRPRDFNHLHADPRFVAYYDELWEELRGEAVKAMTGRP